MTNAYILHRNRISTKILYTARASHYEYYPLVKGNIAPLFSLSNHQRLQNDRATSAYKEELIRWTIF